MIQFCFQPNTTWQNCEEPALLCSALWAVLCWAGLLATRLVGYKRGPKECSPKTSLAYSLWTQAAMSRVQQRAADIFCFGFVFLVFFLFFILFSVCCSNNNNKWTKFFLTSLRQHLIPSLLFSSHRPVHATDTPPLRPIGGAVAEAAAGRVFVWSAKKIQQPKKMKRKREAERERAMRAWYTAI